MMYPEDLVVPMEKDLTDHGFEALDSIENVEKWMNDKSGTKLLVINSVCGCAAANARPGVKQSLQHENVPEKLATVFAGVAKDATNKAREYLFPYPPSSPSIVLFKDGEIVHFIERHHIEGRNADLVAANLKSAYDQFCQNN